MAWRCSGASNRELVENLFQNGLIESPRVKGAMLSVRHSFSLLSSGDLHFVSLFFS